jgi:uncharacterized protein (DUF2141 family)
MALRHFIAAALFMPALALANPAPTPPAAHITLTVTGVAPLQGRLRIATFCSQDAYRALKATSAVIVDATGSRVQTRLPAQPGACVVLVHHDLDGDGKLTLGFMGIPSEPTAASNGAQGVFGPPSWKRAAIAISPGENAVAIGFKAR